MYTTFTTVNGDSYQGYCLGSASAKALSNIGEVMNTNNQRVIVYKNPKYSDVWCKWFYQKPIKKVKEIKRVVNTTETSIFSNGLELTKQTSKVILF